MTKFATWTLTILSLTLLLTALSATTSSAVSPVRTHGTSFVTDPVSPQQFSLMCNPALLTLGAPGAGSSTCYVTSLNSFAGMVGIAAQPNPLAIFGGVCIDPYGCDSRPTDQAIRFNLPITANGATSFTVRVNTLATELGWDYSIVIVANSGAEFHTFILEVNVGPTPGTGPADYSVTSSPSSLSITAGGANGTDTITVSSSAYTDTVTLVAQVDPAVAGGLQISFSGGTNVNSISLTAIVLPGPALTRTATLNVKLPTGASGPFYITIQASGGSSQPIDQKTLIIQVNPPTLTAASFTFTKTGLSATFTATTTGGVAPYTYMWSFGDGTSATTTTNTVTHTYAIAGTYTPVGVKVTDANSVSVNASTQTVTVP